MFGWTGCQEIFKIMHHRSRSVIKTWKLNVISLIQQKNRKYTKKKQQGLIIQMWEYRWVNKVEKPQQPRLAIFTNIWSVVFRKLLQGWFHCRAYRVQLLCLYCFTALFFYFVWIFALENIFFLFIYLLHGGEEEETRLQAMQMSVADWTPSNSLSRARATRTQILKILLIRKPTSTNLHHDGSGVFFFLLRQEIATRNYLFISPCTRASWQAIFSI